MVVMEKLMMDERIDVCCVAGVERVVVMKGRAAVDALCPIASNSHVYEEEDNIWDCMLNQVGVGLNFNLVHFYLLQFILNFSQISC